MISYGQLNENNTFGELAALFESYQKDRVKESSLYTARREIKNHILPFFGKMKMCEITPINILQWQESKSHYSYKYRRILCAHLGAILRFGNRYFDLPNPLTKVAPLRNLAPKKKMEVWSREEFDTFIAVVDEPVYQCLFRFLYITGCRKGEAFALSPNDLDLARGTVSITKSLTRKVEGRPYAITTPKNEASNRLIDLPPQFIKELLSLNTKDVPFLFGGEGPLADNTVSRRFHKWRERAALKRIRVHDLRHSCASYLLSERMPIIAVSERLGHSDVKETLNTYSHLLPRDNEWMNKLFTGI